MKGLVCQTKDEEGMFGGGEEQGGDQATRGSLKWTPQGQVGCVVGKFGGQRPVRRLEPSR